MNISQALRLVPSGVTAFTGGGGKTAAVFMAARELAPALVTTSTHLAARQVTLADRHLLWMPDTPLPDLDSARQNGVTLLTGPLREDIARVTALTEAQLHTLHQFAAEHHLPLLIEADGSRQKPLKAPAKHEPAIPSFADTVIVTAGMRGLDRPLEEQFIHRPEIFSALSGLPLGEAVSADALVRVLTHPQGGLKNIPAQARRIALLNQADTPELQARASRLAEKLLSCFSAVVISSLAHDEIHAAHERIAGIVLAAGSSSRYGQPKQLLDYRGEPFVRRVAKTALAAGLSPVVVVTGAQAEAVEAAVRDLPVLLARNADWAEGQSSSVRAGLTTLTSADVPAVGGAIFLLVDQPQVTVHVLEALVSRHAQGLFPVVLPLVADRRGNPVLFDREVFSELQGLSGDVGGRAVMRNHPLEYLPWHDESLLFDVDNESDYRKLLAWGVEP